ncbi:hypothetical protein C5167_038793 [Papaver somniferum]|uniref:Uncharacterized protein n=1 Tax=Papaver somniferum TaxID=3469 RepID=A0A4Y7IA81_PAPSO|nr:uncharacterized protein LOC113299810 [Papaver somniferum]XP_026404693.1 uncharacterized protein LOC113299810 [Papaver somniferum]RZC45843.1 hypothetical protein C5167_038793 [Papaver somniferum]
MPKGSKKRRAERRKKETGIQTPPNGIEDPKSNYEKDIIEDVSSYTTTTTATGSSNHDLGHDEEESKARLGNTGESKEDEEVNQIIFSKDIKLEDHEEEKIVVIEGDYSDKNSRIIPIDSIKQSDFDSSSDGNNSSGSGSGSSSSGGNSSDEESSLQTNPPVDKKQDEIEMNKEEDYCNIVTDSSPPQYDQIEQEEVISFLTEDVTVKGSSAVKEALAEESSLNDFQSKDMLPTSDDLITEISNGVDGNHQEIHDVSDAEDQQVAPAPPPLQPTSWKGCCGLFDVFMGSNR